MSAIGARPAAAVVMPVGAMVVGAGWVTERTACSTGVMLWVVITQVSTTSLAGMPAAWAAARCELVSWRSGSSAQAVLGGSSGSVLWPPTQSGLVREARK